MKPYPFLTEAHRQVLSGASKNSRIGGDEAVAETYRKALELVDNPDCLPGDGFMHSRMQVADSGMVVATVTRVDNGFYVQLSKPAKSVPNVPPLMTIGTKLAVEATNPIGIAAIKTWF